MLFFEGFRIDQLRAELHRVDGEAIKLRPKTFDMLVFLAGNAGRVLSKQELMEQLWPGVHVGEDSLFQCVREIRTALGDNSRQMVKNISGRGYLFVPAVMLENNAQVDAAKAQPAVKVLQPDTVVPLRFAHEDIAPQTVMSDNPAETPPLDLLPALLARPSAGLKVVATPRRYFGGRLMVVVATGMVALLALAVAVPLLDAGQIFQRSTLTIAIAQIMAVGDDPQVRTMALGATDRLSTGLAGIENIRVVAPPQVTAHATARASLDVAASHTGGADYLVNSELQKSEQGWILRARMTRVSSGEIAWTTTIHVGAGDVDTDTQQARLAAGIGHPLAMRVNAIMNDSVPSATKGALGKAQVAVEQAIASINQTTPERFRAAQAMLEKALADKPDDVDLQAALAALQLRGIQMVWYSPEEREGVRSRGQALLERAIRAKPSYIPVLEGYCRYLSATNQFVESLVACARTLSFDPWDGIALYHIGLGQMFLGRFEDALTNLKQADRFDTPSVSRWTWTLVAGVCELYLGHDEEAIAFLQRSLAVTPGTGRTHLTMVAAYQRLGRFAEAQEMLKAGLALRPGATADNIGPPTENTSPVYLEAAARTGELLIAAGLPAY